MMHRNGRVMIDDDEVDVWKVTKRKQVVTQKNGWVLIDDDEADVWKVTKRGQGMTRTNGRVLIVDDEADVRNVTKRCLEQAGYEVLEAENGEQAIQQIEEGDNPFVLDVIITDINMPKINGLEAIQFFQQEWPHVPLVVMTDYPNLETAKELMKRGLVDYLVKPVDKEKLIAAVEKAMRQRELSCFTN